MKRALVTGAGGFIGWHLVRYLKERGYWVRGVDIKEPEFAPSAADEFVYMDTPCDADDAPLGMRDIAWAMNATIGIDEVYALASDMGGAGYVFTGEHDAVILRNNTQINVATLDAARVNGVGRYLFTSSACVYPEHMQEKSDIAGLAESDAYPAQPDSYYGWEKLHAEHLCTAYRENFGMETRIVRFHNVYGPYGTYCGGREKVPAALCRKVAKAKRDGEHEIEVWGDGEQTRSFLYIDDCLDGLYRAMHAGYPKPLNIGSERMVSINELLQIVAAAAEWEVVPRHDLSKPQGVRGRNSDNTLCREVLDCWSPGITLEDGIKMTYDWIESMVAMCDCGCGGSRDRT